MKNAWLERRHDLDVRDPRLPIRRWRVVSVSGLIGVMLGAAMLMDWLYQMPGLQVTFETLLSLCAGWGIG